MQYLIYKQQNAIVNTKITNTVHMPKCTITSKYYVVWPTFMKRPLTKQTLKIYCNTADSNGGPENSRPGI